MSNAQNSIDGSVVLSMGDDIVIDIASFFMHSGLTCVQVSVPGGTLGCTVPSAQNYGTNVPGTSVLSVLPAFEHKNT